MPPGAYDSPDSGCNRPYRGYVSPHSACIAHIETVTAYKAPITVLIDASKSHTEAVIAHIEAVTSHIHPFELTATGHDKMANPFFVRKGIDRWILLDY